VQKQQFGSPRLRDNRLSVPPHHAAKPCATSTGGAGCLPGGAGAAPRGGSALPPPAAPGPADQVRGRPQSQRHLCVSVLPDYMPERSPHLERCALPLPPTHPPLARPPTRLLLSLQGVLEPAGVAAGPRSPAARAGGHPAEEGAAEGQDLTPRHGAQVGAASAFQPRCSADHCTACCCWRSLLCCCWRHHASTCLPVQQHTPCIFLTPPCCVCTLPAVEQ
jgi:hypothetical protein